MVGYRARGERGHRLGPSRSVTDAILIGGGVIGCSIALELKRRGVHAVVIDRNGEVGHGSTSASCGIVRCYYSTKTMSAMAQEGAEIWRDWATYLRASDPAGLATFAEVGMLFLPPRIDENTERIISHMRELGLEAEILPPEAIVRRFPFMDPASHSPVRSPRDADFFDPTGRRIDGAVFEPRAGYVVSPSIATHNLRVAGEREGVEFILGGEITRIERSGGASPRHEVVLADGSRICADVLVNAAGPHSGVINRMAGVNIGIETRPLRRETHAVSNPAWGSHEVAVPVVGDVDSGTYFRPESGGRDLICGSLDPACDQLEWVDDPDEFDPNTTEEAFERQVMRLMKRYPDVRLGRRRGVAGMYDVTTLDWNPVLDRTELDGFYTAIGTSGSSFKTAPVIGALMAELIVATEGGKDHDKEPLQVRLPRCGFVVDMRFFSRLRSPHTTSGTVLA